MNGMTTIRQRTLPILAGLLLLAGLCARAAERPEPIRGVLYAQRDDAKLMADIYLPEGDGPFPAVVVVHGGAWMSGNRTQMAFVAQRLAARGYVAVAISYRLAPKYKFPAQIEDCKSAVRWMRANAEQYKIDPARIAGWGYSAGGHLVALLGVTDTSHGLEGPDATADSPSTRLQAVVAGGAPCEFRVLDLDSPVLAYWLGGTRREKPDLYDSASPTMFVSADDPPVFFYHGGADRLVEIASPKAMQQALEKAGVETHLYVIPDAGHVPAIFNAEAAEEAVRFLDRHLKGEATSPGQAAGAAR